jgi:two-component system, NtrC family, sensor kinase
MLRARIRLTLVVQAAALAAVVAALLLALGLPLSARGALGPGAVAALAAIAALLVLAVAAAILLRWVGGPVERLLGAAERIGEGSELPPLGLPGEEHGPGLSRAAVAFERTATALAKERTRLAAKVGELEAANRDLAAAREELFRSERLASVGRLASGVAHEIGNPLGAITGYAELARSKVAAGARAEEVADYLGRISEATGRIDAIVRDLLELARPSGPELAPVGVGAALEGALRLARVQPRFRAVRVEVDLPPALPPVLADERRLAQVFLNLLLNAGDATGGGGAIRVAGCAADGGVEVVVSDDGPGIPAGDLPRVFDPFFTTKAPGQGTGLGLAVCHGIMESFGGAIEAVARTPRGAAFRLKFRAAG